MKAKRRKLFSLAVKDDVYCGDNKDKIELVKTCHLNGKSCKKQLSLINLNFMESTYYHRNKDYQNSIEALKSAFHQTYELQDTSCYMCSEFFRATITQSLINIHNELQKMSTGLFGSNRHHGSYLLASNALQSFKNKKFNLE